MKVIFIKDLKKQGRINDVKEVSDGYATNFLIKNGYAVKYTKTSKDILDKDIDNKKKENEKQLEYATKLKNDLEKLDLKFKVSANNGRVFGSISSKQISDELNKLGYKVDKKMISIDSSLSSLGGHQVDVNLHKDVKAKLNVYLVEK